MILLKLSRSLYVLCMCFWKYVYCSLTEAFLTRGFFFYPD